MEIESSTNNLQNLLLRSRKRSLDLYSDSKISEDEPSLKIKLTTKINSEYGQVKDLPAPSKPERPAQQLPTLAQPPPQSLPSKEEPLTHGAPPTRPGVVVSAEEEEAANVEVLEAVDEGHFKLIDSIPAKKQKQEESSTWGLVEYKQATGQLVNVPPSSRSQALALKNPYAELKPQWRAPWKLMRVISGHLGWVRAIAVDISNEWFATGAGDRCIKIWDLASGTLKLTLTGHINCVRGLGISKRSPYLFSCAEDKTVRCWDLESNKSIRHYHGHMSGVYALSMHPTLDVVVTGSRDGTARVWDIRTKAAIHILSGHQHSVCSVACQATDPQVITGSHDSTVKLWDITSGRVITTLTHHKKSVRALAIHPTEYSMATGAPDNIKKWKFPEGKFLQNLSGHRTPIETLAVNADGLLVSGGFNGSMYLWDWKTGYNFQRLETTVQPGSLESEAGIFASTFDNTGSRLITCEADKTIKFWKEDERATEETHPLDWKPTYKH